jgi:hypothetical protein
MTQQIIMKNHIKLTTDFLNFCVSHCGLRCVCGYSFLNDALDHESTVTTAQSAQWLRYGLEEDGPCFGSWYDQDFPLAFGVQTGSGGLSAPVQWVLGPLHSGMKRPKREGDQSSPYSFRLKMSGAPYLRPPCVYASLIRFRENVGYYEYFMGVRTVMKGGY